ncbi:hypothetical protein BGX28_000294, partial [Mortierella sp. GBA30]
MLPEILIHIGNYLEIKDSLICIHVCKLWKFTFEPQLWRAFTLKKLVNGTKSGIVVPSFTLMKRNAPYIRSLTLEDVSAAQGAFFRRCCQVEELHLAIDVRSTKDVQKRTRALEGILQSLPRIRRITIMGYGNVIPNSIFFQNAANCPHLEVLETTGCCFFGPAAETYMRSISANIRRLSSKRDSFERMFVFPDDLNFPELQSLDIQEVAWMTIETQLDWISHCPNLTSIRWKAAYDMPVAKFCQVIPTACPNLTTIELELFMFDSEIAPILSVMPRIEDLTLRINFAELSMNSLRRHFSWLRDINLQFNNVVATGALVHEILCSCPALKTIIARGIQYTDIVAFPQPWICKDLQVFQLNIYLGGTWDAPEEQQVHRNLDENEMERVLNAHREIYDRISQLTNLHHISINFVDFDGMLTTPMPFDAGLGSLATLKRLKHFHCDTLFQKWTISRQEVIKTVEWMVEHWTSLEVLETKTWGDTLEVGREGKRMKIGDFLDKFISSPGIDLSDDVYDAAD